MIGTSYFSGSRLWLYFVMPTSLAASETRVTPVREYKKDNAQLVELSTDGRLILTKGWRWIECANRKGKCFAEVLVVYESLTGKQLGERVANENARFLAAGFVQGLSVTAVEVSYNSQEKRSVLTGIEWNPQSGARTTFQLSAIEELTPVCPLDGNRFIGAVEKGAGYVLVIRAVCVN